MPPPLAPAILKAQLVAKLATIAGLEHRPSPVAGGSALFYRDKPLGHFHDEGELDLRLTAAVIQRLGLTHPAGSIHHPDRSPRSPWIELRLATRADVNRVAALVRLAIEQR